MKSTRLTKSVYSLKYSLREFFEENKVKIIICLLFCLCGLLTGIFTAIKLNNLNDTDIFESFNLTYQITDFENFSQNFFSRLLSYFAVVLILTVLSLHSLLYVFADCLLAYRTFLIMVNCVMIILWFSFGGIIKSILVILPCQILMILIMIIYFCYVSSVLKQNSYCKGKKFSNIVVPLLLCLLALTIVNLIETILLFILRSNVILVI